MSKRKKRGHVLSAISDKPPLAKSLEALLFSLSGGAYESESNPMDPLLDGVVELGCAEPMRGRGRGVHGERAVPSAAHRLDNVSARVAPWCDCGASGNRREECETFRGLFTRNRCLGEGPGWGRVGVHSALTAWSQAAVLAGAHFRDGAIQTFDGGWPPILQDQLDPHRDPEHNVLQVSSSDGPLGWSSLLSMLPVLALQPLL
nr:GDNF family receptor alpha-4 [Vicugna pacos]